MNKFKAGDRVRFVANPLPRFPADPGVTKKMEGFVKKAVKENTVFTVSGKIEDPNWYYISLDNGCFVWDDRWLVLADDGPKRDARGRFMKKGVAEAPKKEGKPVVKDVPKETVRDELTNKTGDNAGICSYAIQYEKGTAFQVRDACHARLKANRQDEFGKPLYAALNMGGHFMGKTDQWKNFFPKFLKWALNESSFKNCFITKCEKEAVEKGILLNMDEMNSRVVAAAIFLRSLTEYPITSVLMEKLVNKGVPYAIAWMISQGVSNNTFNDYGGGHHCIIGTMPFDVLKNGILNDKPLPDIKEVPFKDYPGKYTIFKAVCGINLYYGGDKVAEGVESLSDFMKKFGKEVDGVWGIKTMKYTNFDLLKIAAAMSA